MSASNGTAVASAPPDAPSAGEHAAIPVPSGSARFCARGCGRSLDGYRQTRKYCGAPDCKAGPPAPARVKKTDTPVVIEAGPDSYWSSELPASRGQLATIAHLACDLLHISAPRTRLEATLAMARLRMALSRAPAPPPLASAEALAAVEQVTPEDAEEVAGAEWKDADARRGGSDMTAGRTFQCGSCKRFIRNPGSRCPHCGFEPDMGW